MTKETSINNLMIKIIFLTLLTLLVGCNPVLTKVACPEDVIPERINLIYFDDSKFYQLERDFLWNDGGELANFAMPRFYYGNEEGQNLNLIYSDGFGMKYYKKNIQSDGTIGKDTKFTAYLVIDPNDKTEGGYKLVSYKCG